MIVVVVVDVDVAGIVFHMMTFKFNAVRGVDSCNLSVSGGCFVRDRLPRY